ncbi:MAG: IS1634 family transposase, partial [Alphaproteobacteria bacterium]|nr:IS1634 family transposase [Alphaproteobacteria bacterium]
MALSVDVIPNRSSPPAILLREAWRDGRRIRRRTLANLSKMPPTLVDAIRAALAGGVVFASLDAAVTIRRSRPHGHVAAILGTLRRIGLV